MEFPVASWPQHRNVHPLPAPPKADKPLVTVSAEEKKAVEAARSSSYEDRWAALKAYRRARGLCDKCAKKYTRGHRCAPTVQLHVLQEVFQLFHTDDDTQSVHSGQSIEAAQLNVMLSAAAVSGVDGPRTIRFVGMIQGHEVLILVDSGSTHSFISSSLSDVLQGKQQLQQKLSVKVANGQVLHCDSHFSNTVWQVQKCSFTSEFRVLPLSHFDIIIGMDWLELYSPMKVHWREKWMMIPYQGYTVTLQGIITSLPAGSVLQLLFVAEGSTPVFDASLPPTLLKLLQQFADAFTPPDGLPPSRACDHEIPLIEGARPVNIRPYRVAPALKDEIEKQVAEMLEKGIIQKSTSPFSSPVLLVKKKDHTYRFCVDFRHLNALTKKGRYPVPIIEEFLDELNKASWFTSLDLLAGFHQILLKSGEEYKTAFQTHSGHYEFRVMAFGLTGAPASFQCAMNTTLAPLLRKCVLVFFDDILVYSNSYGEHLEHVAAVLQLLRQDQWKIKLSKCKFAQQEIAYLGYVISEKGVAIDPSKISAILN